MPSNDPLHSTLTPASSILVTAADRVNSAAFEQFVRPRIPDGNLAAVLYERSGTSFVEDLVARRDQCPNDARILDVGGQLRSSSQDSARDAPVSTTVVGSVARVDDVATVFRELERTFEEWGAREGPAVLYVDSLTPLLHAVDGPLVGDFLERITGMLRRWDALGVIQVDAAEHDERTLDGLGRRADARVELAGEADDVECTVVDPGAATWLVASTGAERPHVDVALDLLRIPERRALLTYLSIAGTATLEELAEHLAGRPDVAGTEVEQLRIALHQVHLPKLAQAGVVERDADARYVELQSPGEALLDLLDVANAYDRR